MEEGFSRCRISSVEEVAPEVRCFRLEGALPARRPGQYVVLKIGELERSYSMSGPVDADYFEVTVRLAGAFTNLLFGMKEGDEILAKGPAGRFVFDEEKIGSTPVVFIAGGVGIAPILSMIDYVAKKDLPGEFTLIFGNRAPGEIIHGARLAGYSDKIKTIHTVDRADPADGWGGHVGFIDRGLIEASVPKPQEARYFICGPPVMVKGIVAALKELGVPLTSINLEGW